MQLQLSNHPSSQLRSNTSCTLRTSRIKNESDLVRSYVWDLINNKSCAQFTVTMHSLAAILTRQENSNIHQPDCLTGRVKVTGLGSSEFVTVGNQAFAGVIEEEPFIATSGLSSPESIESHPDTHRFLVTLNL